jgi:hypothetical protein
MRPSIIAEAEVVQVAIRQEIDRSEESRYDYRLCGVLLVTVVVRWPPSTSIP